MKVSYLKNILSTSQLFRKFSTSNTFRAVLLSKTNGKVIPNIVQMKASDLPTYDNKELVEVEVAYSCINYKDALVIHRNGMVKKWPHIPGIDFSGTVVSSQTASFPVGSQVLCTGFRVGEWYWGGFSGRCRVPSSFLLPVSWTSNDMKYAMMMGTAGLTASISVIKLIEEGGLKKEGRPVLVTGSSGGVGSICVSLLKAAGFSVIAYTRKKDKYEKILQKLGADEIIDSFPPSDKPISPELYGGAIDVLGGSSLKHIISSLSHRRSVAVVGLAESNTISASITPFLLRGIRLLGIESAQEPIVDRQYAWSFLTEKLPPQHPSLNYIVKEINLDQVIDTSRDILENHNQFGRYLVNVKKSSS